MKNFPILKRKRILIGNQYTYIYTFKGSIVDMMLEGSNLGLNVIHQMIDFLNKTLACLTNLNSQERAKSKIYPTLLLRVKELVDFWEYYLNLFLNFSPNLKEKKIDRNIYQEIENNESNLTVDDIERKIVNIPIITFGFIVYNKKYTKILSYLTLRKRLQQDELYKLTGFSTGYISQALKFLIELDFVKKVKIVGIRKPYYEVDSIPLSYLKRIRNWFFFIVKWKPELENYFKELNDNMEKLKNLNGYKRIKELLKSYLQLIPMLEKILGIIERELEKYKTRK